MHDIGAFALLDCVIHLILYIYVLLYTNYIIYTPFESVDMFCIFYNTNLVLVDNLNIFLNVL